MSCRRVFLRPAGVVFALLCAAGTAQALDRLTPDGPTLKQRQDCEMHVTRGQIALQAGQVDGALGAFNQGLVAWPQCYLAMEGLAVVAERQGDLKGAIEHYLRAKHASPDDRWGHQNFHVGRLYVDLKADERAETYLEVALSQDANVAQTHYLLGFIHHRRGDYLKAEEHFLSADRLVRAGDAWAQDRRLKQAVSYYLGETYVRLGFNRRVEGSRGGREP